MLQVFFVFCWVFFFAFLSCWQKLQTTVVNKNKLCNSSFLTWFEYTSFTPYNSTTSTKTTEWKTGCDKANIWLTVKKENSEQMLIWYVNKLHKCWMNIFIMNWNRIWVGHSYVHIISYISMIMPISCHRYLIAQNEQMTNKIKTGNTRCW